MALISVALVTETTGAVAPEGQAPETRAPKQTTGRRALASKPVPLRVIWSPPLVPPLLGVTLVSLGMLTLVKVKPPLTVVTWPSRFLMMTGTAVLEVTGWAGVRAVIWPSPLTMTWVAAEAEGQAPETRLARQTTAPAEKPEPGIVRAVPPFSVPLAGAMLVMAGALAEVGRASPERARRTARMVAGAWILMDAPLFRPRACPAFQVFLLVGAPSLLVSTRSKPLIQHSFCTTMKL